MRYVPRADQIAPGRPVHVVLEANNRRRLFSYPSCYSSFITTLGRQCARHRCALHALTLAHGHVQLVMTPPSAEALSKCVQSVAQRHAVRRNRAFDGTGRVFRAGFEAFPLLDDLAVARRIAWIELEPVRLGLATEVDRHRWSTFGLHAALDACAIPRTMWTPCSWWRSLGHDVAARGTAYRAWIEACRGLGDALADDRSLLVMARASEPYTRRLERPNRTRACEVELRYRRSWSRNARSPLEPR